MAHARRHLRDFVANLLTAATATGQVRGDIALVTVTLAGLRPQP
jgi:hypothetical protein